MSGRGWGKRAGILLTPSDVKIEISGRQELKQPIVFDHAPFYVPEASLQEMENYYKNMYGAKLVKGEPDTLSLPGGKLVFSKSASIGLKAPTGSSLTTSASTSRFSRGSGSVLQGARRKGTKWSAKYRRANMERPPALDPAGVIIELTHGQDGYINYKAH